MIWMHPEASPAFFVFRRGTDGGQQVMSWTGASVEKFEANAGLQALRVDGDR